jgi:hypothetical protein
MLLVEGVEVAEKRHELDAICCCRGHSMPRFRYRLCVCATG